MSETWAERTATRVLNSIPGYAGYRDKESRRDADRAVRDRLAAELANRADRIERTAAHLSDARRLSEVGPVNAFAGAARHQRDRIVTASYGYGGLFSDRNIDARVLDQIRLFDESLFAGLEQIDTAIARLEQALSSGGDLQTAAVSGQRVIDDLGARFDQRNAVIDTATRASADQMENVLAVLRSPEEQEAASASPAAFELQDRDTLSVLGDNFVVDARIDVEAAEESFRVFRVDVAPERWLFVPKQPGTSFALLTTSAEPNDAGPSPAIGDGSYAVESSGQGTGDMAGAGGQSGRQPVSYTLLRGSLEPAKRAVVLRWGAEQLLLTGNDVNPNDVELFGKPG